MASVLAEGPVGGVAGGFQIARQRLPNVVAPRGRLGLRPYSGIDGAGPDNLKESLFDGIVHTKIAKGDATGLAIVHPAPVAGVSGNVCLSPLYRTVNLRPQRRHRTKPANSALPCLAAP